jgi:DNA-binding transcriptional LysR family regulator
MDVRQLELFLAVMESSSVTLAAGKVNLTPGAVSLQMHRLAAELHAELFAHSGKHIVPTPDALRLAGHARGVLARVRQIELEFQNGPAGDTRPFHFATGATTLIHRLGKPLGRLRKKYPRNQMQVTVAPTEEIVAGLHDRRFDLGLISLPVPEDELIVLPLFEEELLGLRPSPRRVRNANPVTIKPAELVDVPFLLYPRRSNMRTIIERSTKEAGLNLRVIMEADDTEAIKRLVEAGFGHSILPHFALGGHSSFFQVFRIAGCRLVRHQALAMGRTAYPRALTESIARFLRDALARP